MTGRYRHRIRGSVYEVVGTAEAQATSPIADGTTVVVYRGADGTLWVRSRAEFLDGRFALIPDSTEGE